MNKKSFLLGKKTKLRTIGYLFAITLPTATAVALTQIPLIKTINKIQSVIAYDLTNINPEVAYYCINGIYIIVGISISGLVCEKLKQRNKNL